MGSWGIKLFNNDLACDVRDTYMGLLEKQVDDENAYRLTCYEYTEIFTTNEEPLFWLAMAHTQYKVGRLMPEVKEKALAIIVQEDWKQFDQNEKLKGKWIKEMEDLRNMLSSPPPKRRHFATKQSFVTNPWNVGDIFAYKFHTKAAESAGFASKYIVFQKIADVEFYENTFFSAVHVFDEVFDHVPLLDEVKNQRILPLITPNKTDDQWKLRNQYIPSFEWYLSATMILNQKKDFPEKYTWYIGNCKVQETHCEANSMSSMFWEKEGMEAWLIEYYTQWHGACYPS